MLLSNTTQLTSLQLGYITKCSLVTASCMSEAMNRTPRLSCAHLILFFSSFALFFFVSQSLYLFYFSYCVEHLFNLTNFSPLNLIHSSAHRHAPFICKYSSPCSVSVCFVFSDAVIQFPTIVFKCLPKRNKRGWLIRPELLKLWVGQQIGSTNQI